MTANKKRDNHGTCIHCGNGFIGAADRQFCSRKCAQRAALQRLEDDQIISTNAAAVALRRAAVWMLGNQCVHCGSRARLHIHHRDGSGTAHRRSLKTTEYYADIIRTINSGRYEVLCYACHGTAHGKHAQRAASTS